MSPVQVLGHLDTECVGEYGLKGLATSGRDLADILGAEGVDLACIVEDLGNDLTRRPVAL